MEKDRLDTLMEQYENLAAKLAGATFYANQVFYSALGVDRDDFMQEARMGLYKALLSFDPARAAKFDTYASKCIKNEMLAYVRSASRKSNMVLSDAEPLENAGEKVAAGPENEVIFKEMLLELSDGEKTGFSPLETKVADLLVQGKNYKEIAAVLGKTPKQVDNAIQRLRVKLKTYLS